MVSQSPFLFKEKLELPLYWALWLKVATHRAVKVNAPVHSQVNSQVIKTVFEKGCILGLVAKKLPHGAG